MDYSELEHRLAELELAQIEMEQNLEKTKRLIGQLRVRQLKEGPLAPLAEALVYHHHMVKGWDYIAQVGDQWELTPDNYRQLYTEFVRMRQVVIHYEYTVQRLLGINPSPLADLEEDKG